MKKMKKQLFDLPIKKKMILVMALVSGIVLVLASSVMLLNDVLRFRHNMVEGLYSLTELVALSNSAGVFFGIADTPHENLKVLAASPGIVEAVLFTQDGAWFAAYSRETSPSPSIVSNQPGKSLLQYYFAKESANHTLDEIPPQGHIFRRNALEVFKPIIFEGNTIGTAYLRSDLQAFYQHLWRAGLLFLGVLAAAFLLTIALAWHLQRLVTDPVYKLLRTMEEVVHTNDYSRREKKVYDDELGKLCDGFNRMLAHIEKRDQELANANSEISNLNQRLKAENLRMSAELDVTRRMQQMVLPDHHELEDIADLEISGFMEPADEVGGDYYDVLKEGDRIKIGIGDVTGHGLESGVIMLMVQTLVRGLLLSGIDNAADFMDIVNRTIYANIQRIGSDKNMTLALLDYHHGTITVTGQHEQVLVVRKNGSTEWVDTLKLGFMVGVVSDIGDFIATQKIHLEPGDGIVLYTDGITEAGCATPKQAPYGEERLREMISNFWHLSAGEICDRIVANVREYAGADYIIDDITLVIVRRQ